MAYIIEFTTSALRELRSLPRDIQRRIQPKIDGLAENPLPAGVKKLTGEPAHFRIRVGKYRVIYRIEGHRLVVVIVRIAHRRDVYR